MESTGREMTAFLLKVADLGAQPLLVGGAVIDILANRQVKDWDIEIHGLAVSQIVEVVESLGHKANLAGASFGVIKTMFDGVDIDLSVPRRENKVGKGHKGFEATFDQMSHREAARRRDITINAMMLDLLTEELIDPFDGASDLAEGRIRAVDANTFAEDPLRVLRVVQLLPRKGKFVEPSTINLCRSMIGSFYELPAERLLEEFRKLLLKAKKPSLGLEFLNDCGWLMHFPELNALVGCQQNPEHHPEGDVWTHTMMVVDAAAEIRSEIPEDLRFPFMLAALLHDVGKPSTTAPDLSSHGHDKAGVPIASEFLSRIKASNAVKSITLSLVEFHMRPWQLLSGEAKLSAWRRLRLKVDLNLLVMLAVADHAGRLGHSVREVKNAAKPTFDIIRSLDDEPTAPLVTGKDLIERGFAPGPEMGKKLRELFELQLEGATREELLASL